MRGVRPLLFEGVKVMQLSKLLDPLVFNELCNAVQLDPKVVELPRVHKVVRTNSHLSLRYGDDDRGFDIPKPYKSNMSACCSASKVFGKIPRGQILTARAVKKR
jgi:hypothetical protein